MVRTFQSCSLPLLSWETWWNNTMSSSWVLISFIPNVLNLIGPGKSRNSFPFLSPFSDLYLATMPWLSSSGLTFDRNPRLWPTPSYYAYSVTIKYGIERSWKTYFICQSLSNNNVNFLGCLLSVPSSASWGLKSWDETVIQVPILLIGSSFSGSCGDSCLRYKWLGIEKLSHLRVTSK